MTGPAVPSGAATLAAALLFGTAVVVVIGGRRQPWYRLGRRTGPGPPASLVRWSRQLTARSVGLLAWAVSGSVAAVVGLVWGGPVAAVYSGACSMLAVRGIRTAAAARAERRAAAAVDDLVSGLAADLRAGLSPAAALAAGVEALASTDLQTAPAGFVGLADRWSGGAGAGRRGVATLSDLRESTGVAGSSGLAGSTCLGRVDAPGGMARPAAGVSASSPSSALAPAAAASAAGQDVPATLRGVSLPGAELGLSRLAAAWQVADSSGAPLAAVLDRLDCDLTALRRQRSRVRAQTATASATVRMLALLPLLGLGLGYFLGGDPVEVLLHTPIGAGCALGALALQVSGLLWSERITAAATRAVGA